MPMNYYGETAREHWARWLPGQFAEIRDRDSFFSTLGSQAEARIDALADELAGDDRPGEGYLGKVARLTTARTVAEELILPHLVMPAPEDEEEP